MSGVENPTFWQWLAIVSLALAAFLVAWNLRGYKDNQNG